MLILFIRYKRTLIALLKLYATTANNTLIASPFRALFGCTFKHKYLQDL